MGRKILVWLLISFFLTSALYVEAQQQAKIPRIGYLSGGSRSSIAARIAAFRTGLRELGYVEGKNIIIEWRFADGNADRLPALAAELVRLKVDVIVTGGSTATHPVRDATSTIPIVMAQDPDPVGTGFVASLAQPGGNITGLSTLSPELSGKRVELMKEIVPRLSRLAVFGTSTNPGDAQMLKEIEPVIRVLSLKLQHIDVLAAKGIEPAFRAAAKGRADAVLMNVSGVVAAASRKEIVQLAVKNRLAVMYIRAEYVDEGGLVSYGVSIDDLDRRAATYVDKILKGRKPTDLPVEQPMKFDFVINLKAAKAIGLTIPPNVLVRATKVIR